MSPGGQYTASAWRAGLKWNSHAAPHEPVIHCTPTPPPPSSVSQLLATTLNWYYCRTIKFPLFIHHHPFRELLATIIMPCVYYTLYAVMNGEMSSMIQFSTQWQIKWKTVNINRKRDWHTPDRATLMIRKCLFMMIISWEKFTWTFYNSSQIII